MSASTRQPDASRLPAIGVFAALLALVLTAAVALSSITEFEHRAAEIARTDLVISRIEEIKSMQGDARSAVRGFVIAGESTFLRPYQRAQRDMPQRLTALRALVAGDPAQAGDAAALETQIKASSSIEASLLAQRISGGTAAAAALVASGEGESVMERVRTGADRMIARERQALGEREVVAARSALHARTLIVLGALIGAAIFTATFLLLRSENRKRRLVDRTLTEVNAALQQRAVELETSNHELESFSYSISHDLRIPLRAISGYARMLEEDYADKFDSEGNRLLTVIRDNSKRMGALIDDLLAFSKLGRQSMQMELVDMQELLDGVVEQVRRKDEYPNSHLEVGQLPSGYGDRALLQQVWVNLLSNALKYSGTVPQPMIRVSGHETGFETIYVVTDNGVGFDMQYYGKLFGVFQRLHSQEAFPGTGVGLAITQRIVNRHRGRIWAESKVDAGATFFFALPRQELVHG